MTFWTILGWALLVLAGYFLWRGTQGITAKAVMVGALLLVAFPDPVGSRGQFWRDLGEAQVEGNLNGVIIESNNSTCVFCVSRQRDERWQLTSRFLSGNYTVDVQQPQPYALFFQGGRVLRDGQALTPGCVAGTLETETVFDFDKAARVDFQVGPGSVCR